MPRPRAILFDAVGTLIFPRPAVAVAYQSAGRRFGCDLPQEEIVERFRRAFARQEAQDAQDHKWRTTEDRERERWRAIVAEVFPTAAEPERLFQALWEHFAARDHWALFPDVAPCWRELAAQPVRLGIASNLDARLTPICRGLPPLDECRQMFVSSLLGVRKPGLGFFRAIERALDLPGEQILLVGDDLENDYQAAQAAGWQAVLLVREEKPLPPEVRRIASLAELATC